MLVVQVVVTAGAASIAWLWDARTAAAVVLGGLACILPTLVSGRRAFAPAPARGGMRAGYELAALYRAEIAKVVGACGLLVLAGGVWPEVPFGVLCVAFVVVQMSSAVLTLAVTDARDRDLDRSHGR